MGSGLGTSVDEKWAEATAGLLTDMPAGDENLMARISIVLAWVDWGFRSGGKWSEGLRAVAKSTRRGGATNWESYTASVDTGIASEVAALIQIAELPQADPALCGATFSGSRFVGGADADMILDDCLYDVKTTQRPRRELTPMLRQLLGYALLDWDDEFGLKRVGCYWSRQGKWMSWNLAELVEHVAGPGASLYALRDDFRHRARITPMFQKRVL